VRFEHELAVDAPAAATWAALIDPQRLARAVPGATLAAGSDGALRGRVGVRLGPAETAYDGVARLRETDEDERVATWEARGRTAGGGVADAVITARVVPAGGATRVLVETALICTGRPGRLAEAPLAGAAGGALGELARRLTAEMASQPGRGQGRVARVVPRPSRPAATAASAGVAAAATGLAGLLLARRWRR
jgi:carbon monoxide dehydrogenase subunit G